MVAARLMASARAGSCDFMVLPASAYRMALARRRLKSRLLSFCCSGLISKVEPRRHKYFLCSAARREFSRGDANPGETRRSGASALWRRPRRRNHPTEGPRLSEKSPSAAARRRGASKRTDPASGLEDSVPRLARCPALLQLFATCGRALNFVPRTADFQEATTVANRRERGRSSQVAIHWNFCS